MKHGKARNVTLRLAAEDGHGMLSVIDDGLGIGEDRQNSQGMGLNIMGYRSSMIGGRLEVKRNGARGTIVSCVFPLKAAR